MASASYTDEPVRYDLGAEDAIRVARLSEETRGRIEEIALIIARVKGERLEPDTPRQFVTRVPPAEMDPGPILYMDIHDDGCCLVVFADGRHWYECPCGITGTGPL